MFYVSYVEAPRLASGGVRRFFFNDTASTEIYTLSLHDALPISLATQTQELCRYCAPTPIVSPGNGRVRWDVKTPEHHARSNTLSHPRLALNHGGCDHADRSRLCPRGRREHHPQAAAIRRLQRQA